MTSPVAARRRSVQGCRWLPWGAVGAEAGGAAGQSGDGAAPITPAESVKARGNAAFKARDGDGAAQ